MSEQILKQAIVRPPAPNFADGLTTSPHLGAPQFELALAQHAAYCKALSRCGVTVTTLEPDPTLPDSTFVEDTAVLADRCAVITRPGAPSRRAEVESIRNEIANFYPNVFSIQEPGTLDGGDVCRAGDHFFIGMSERTNETGAQQLAGLFSLFGYSSSFIDIRGIDGLLHLKSGLAYLDNHRLLVASALEQKFAEIADDDYEIIPVVSDEQYAANCLYINGYVLLASGYPNTAQTLESYGYNLLVLEMTEFQKMDGGLSCLSLRF